MIKIYKIIIVHLLYVCLLQAMNETISVALQVQRVPIRTDNIPVNKKKINDILCKNFEINAAQYNEWVKVKPLVQAYNGAVAVDWRENLPTVLEQKFEEPNKKSKKDFLHPTYLPYIFVQQRKNDDTIEAKAYGYKVQYVLHFKPTEEENKQAMNALNNRIITIILGATAIGVIIAGAIIMFLCKKYKV